LIVTDILQVLYAPHKAFKQIVQKPRYWGVLIVLVIFVAAQTDFYYSQYSNIYFEQTSPAGDQLGTWSGDITLWTGSSGVNITNNYIDRMNNTAYGNGSLQFALSASNNMFMELNNFDSVNCSPKGFENLSMRIKIVEPQSLPKRATLNLYSLSNSEFFQYDLTTDFANSVAGIWNNLTVPVGSGSWLSNGNPTWENITGLRLDFVFSTNSSITIRITGLFFRGMYQTQTQADSTGLLINALQIAFTQFLFQWIILTGLLYIIIKGLKGALTWKPLFIAVGIVLITMAVQSIINIAAWSSVPSLYVPVEYFIAPGEAQLTVDAITAATATYSLIAGAVQVVTYVWIVSLGAIIIRTVTTPVGEAPAVSPQFGWVKSLLVSAASFLLRLLILFYLGI
jgi:hypothetical protein